LIISYRLSRPIKRGGEWRLVLGFRIQDEARIKSKSKEMKIQFFYFPYEQTLQLVRSMIYKKEVSFKRFLILFISCLYILSNETNKANETNQERAEKAERRAKKLT
jgi:hypothetical protein